MEKKISDYSFKRPKRYTFLKVIPAYLVYLSLGIIGVVAVRLTDVGFSETFSQLKLALDDLGRLTTQDYKIILSSHLMYAVHVFLYHVAIVKPYEVTFTNGVLKEKKDIFGNTDSTDFSRIEDLNLKVGFFDFFLGLAEVNFINKETPYKPMRHRLSGFAKSEAEELKDLLSRHSYSNYTEMVQKSGTEPSKSRRVISNDGGGESR
jgi:hypothetical protein